MTPIEKRPWIEIRNATVLRGDTTALRGFSWTIRPGEHWAVLGPNGSGKSTLVQLLQGWLWPRSGEIEVLGRKFGSQDLSELRRRVAWVGSEAESEIPARQTVFEITASGAVGTLGIQFDKPNQGQRRAAEKALAAVGLTRLGNRSFRELSQGQRRLVLIARALAMGPDLLLLDEPAAGLDPVARESFLARVGRLLKPQRLPLVVYITHHLEEVLPGFTKVLLLRKGRVVAAGPKEKVFRPAQLRTAFGSRLALSGRGIRFGARLS